MKALMWTVAALGLACLIALFLAPFASRNPDGLETIAKKVGFANRFEAPSTLSAPMSDYGIPAVANEKLGTGISGAIGVLAGSALMVVVAWILVRNGKR